MIEAILGYLVISEILGVVFLELTVNAAVFEILFGAVVVIGILLMFAMKSKTTGTVVFVAGVAAFVIVQMLVPHADIVARWGGVVAAVAMVIMAKVMTYRALHRRARGARQLRWWQTALIYLV